MNLPEKKTDREGEGEDKAEIELTAKGSNNNSSNSVLNLGLQRAVNVLTLILIAQKVFKMLL